MNKVIYIDFDGVLVDTPKFINEELKINGNSEEICKKPSLGLFFEKL